MACCQIALAHGLHVLATAGSDRGLAMLQQQNITSTFNHNKKGYVREIQVSFDRAIGTEITVIFVHLCPVPESFLPSVL